MCHLQISLLAPPEGFLVASGAEVAPWLRVCGHSAQMRSRRGVCAVRRDVGRPVGGAGVSRPLFRAPACDIPGPLVDTTLAVRSRA